MKKIFLLVLFCSLVVLSNNLILVKADSTSISMGFSVDSNQYGEVEMVRYATAYSYIPSNNQTYAIGYSRIKSAVYQDITDSDWALVLYQSTANPLDVVIPFLGIPLNYNSVTEYQTIYSDVDNCGIGFGYGAYITSVNYVMEQPSPRVTPTTTTYSVSLEVGEETKVSASINFDDNELDLIYNHSAADNVFEVSYIYSANGTSDIYMNKLTYNIGTFLVDMSIPNLSNAGQYVNTVSLTSRFSTSNFFYTPIISYMDTTIYETVYY